MFWPGVTHGTLPAEYPHTDVIAHLELSPDGTSYLSASWDAATGELLQTLTSHRGRVWHAAFTLDGGRIVTAGADGSVIVWDAGSGERLFALGSQPEAILSLAFSTGGKFLSALSAGGLVTTYVLPAEDLLALARDRLTRELTREERQRYLHLDRCTP